MKVGNRVYIKSSHVAGLDSELKKIFKNLAYARITSVKDFGSYTVDVYGHYGNIIFCNHDIIIDDMVLAQEDQYSLDLVMHNILVNLDKLEKRVKQKNN